MANKKQGLKASRQSDEDRRVARLLARDHDPTLPDGSGHEGKPPILRDVDGITEEEKRARAVLQRNERHCTICYLKFRKNISDIQHTAGERLQSDAALAGLSSIPGSQMLGGGGGITGPAEIGQIKIDASRRLETAMLVVGTSARFLLEQIVVGEHTIEKAAQVLRCSRNAVVPALRVALDALAQHYGIAGTSGDTKSRIRTLHPFNNENFSPGN